MLTIYAKDIVPETNLLNRSEVACLLVNNVCHAVFLLLICVYSLTTGTNTMGLVNTHPKLSFLWLLLTLLTELIAFVAGIMVSSNYCGHGSYTERCLVYATPLYTLTALHCLLIALISTVFLTGFLCTALYLTFMYVSNCGGYRDHIEQQRLGAIERNREYQAQQRAVIVALVMGR